MLTKKVCLIGDYSVGKTSLFRRFMSNEFSEQYITTVGVKVETKLIQLSNGEPLKLVVWDIAGADRLSSVGKHYLQGAHGYLLVADGTREKTLEAALSLKSEADSFLQAPPFVGLLNKHDLTDQWVIPQDFLDNNNCWMTTSALSGEGVEAAFTQLADRLVTT